MNWYSIFYWLTVADSVKKFFDTTSNIFTWFAVLSFLVVVATTIGKSYQISENSIKTPEEEATDADVRSWDFLKRISSKFFWWMLPLALVTWLGYVMTPTKKDCLLIVAGGAVGNFMTTDTSARKLPSDVTKFLHLSLKNEIAGLSDTAKKELGITTPKDEFLKKAAKMSKEQLLKYLQADTTVLKDN
ncbi:MAG: hypothetical protein ABIO57_03695 [Candidatus Paceibacterota bacterium]